jgi:hypothetical protein
MPNITKGLYDDYDQGMEALDARRDWETRIAQLHAQRYGYDAPPEMNYPWPGASNHRYLLADMTIARLLPIRSKLIYSSKNIVNMIARKKEMISKAPLMSGYFDFFVKQRTPFEKQIQYCANYHMQDGLTIMKTFFDWEKKKIVDEVVPSIFFIVPSDTHDLHEAPWCIHVIQKSVDWVRERFSESCSDKAALEKLLKGNKEGSGESTNADSGGLQKHQYDRMGISRSKAQTRTITLWERHFRKDGKQFIKYIAPDDPGLTLCEAFAYPYDSMQKVDRYCFESSKFEELTPHFYDTRGITAKATEWEHLITAMLRAWLNSTQLYCSPVFYPQTPDSLPSNTQNLDWAPGSILPAPLIKVDMGNPPVEFQQIMNFGRETFERWTSQPDYGLGKANTLGDARTATEIKALTFQQSLNTESDLNNWKLFIGEIMKKKFGLLNEYKNQITEWDYMTKDGFEQFDPSVLSEDYFIEVNGSADALNREAQLNNAIALLNLGLQVAPTVSPGSVKIVELFKNVVENAAPESVDRFVGEDGQAQADSARNANIDMGTLLQTGILTPKQGGDPLINSQVAIQTLQKLMRSGEGVDQKVAGQLSEFLIANRDQLKKTNKQGYEQVTALMDQLDQAAHAAMFPQPQIAAA